MIEKQINPPHCHNLLSSNTKTTRVWHSLVVSNRLLLANVLLYNNSNQINKSSRVFLISFPLFPHHPYSDLSRFHQTQRIPEVVNRVLGGKDTHQFREYASKIPHINPHINDRLRNSECFIIILTSIITSSRFVLGVFWMGVPQVPGLADDATYTPWASTWLAPRKNRQEVAWRGASGRKWECDKWKNGCSSWRRRRRSRKESLTPRS